MKLRDMANLAVRPLLKSELRKIQRGSDIWRDVHSFVGKEKARVLFDIGANFGQSAEHFLELFPKTEIYSFEPAPGSFAKLEAFARDKPRVHAINQGLGPARGQFEFQENEFSETNSFLSTDPAVDRYLKGDCMKSIRRTMVEVNTLDSFCEEKKIGRIDVAKLDVQGFELNILQGAHGLLKRQAIGVLALEIIFIPLYENQATFCQLQELLARYNYHVSGFYNYAYAETGRLMWCDALFIPSE